MADTATKKIWKLHQTIDDLQKWTQYLQQSADGFLEEVARIEQVLDKKPATQKTWTEIKAGLELLKKESALLKTRSRRLRKEP